MQPTTFYMFHQKEKKRKAKAQQNIKLKKNNKTFWAKVSNTKHNKLIQTKYDS